MQWLKGGSLEGHFQRTHKNQSSYLGIWHFQGQAGMLASIPVSPLFLYLPLEAQSAQGVGGGFKTKDEGILKKQDPLPFSPLQLPSQKL